MGYLLAFLLGIMVPIVFVLLAFHQAEVQMLGITGDDIPHLSSLPHRKWWYKVRKKFKR